MEATFPIGARATDPESYGIVMGRFAACVVLINIFNRRMKTIPVEEDKLWTVSDEAFLYVVIENAYARWADMLLRKHAHAHDPSQSLESDVTTKYTFEGSAVTRQGRFKGWSVEGVQRYSDIYKIVEKDRRNNVGVYHEWARKQQPATKPVESRTARDRELGDVDVPTDSFWDHMNGSQIHAPPDDGPPANVGPPANDGDLFDDDPDQDQINVVQM